MLSRSGGNLTVRNKGKSTGTIDGKREGKVLSQEATRLFKTQDVGYVRTVRNQVRKEVETLEERVKGFQGVGRGGERVVGGGERKTVFLKDEAELAVLTEGVESDYDSEDDEDMDLDLDLDLDFDISGGEAESEEEVVEEKEKDDPKLTAQERAIRNLQKKEQRRVENKLELARERLKVLTEAEEALDLQRAKMNKTPSTGGVTKAGAKFKIRGRKG